VGEGDLGRTGQTSDWQTRTISPLSQALPKCVTPELEYLQTKWAAHLPYAAATTLLKLWKSLPAYVR